MQTFINSLIYVKITLYVTSQWHESERHYLAWTSYDDWWCISEAPEASRCWNVPSFTHRFTFRLLCEMHKPANTFPHSWRREFSDLLKDTAARSLEECGIRPRPSDCERIFRLPQHNSWSMCHLKGIKGVNKPDIKYTSLGALAECPKIVSLLHSRIVTFVNLWPETVIPKRLDFVKRAFSGYYLLKRRLCCFWCPRWQKGLIKGFFVFCFLFWLLNTSDQHAV